ncbi:MAG TPA: hypothetical protein DEA08_00370 [Planctomycetes bacterium]|nr:hypothetical protein [Planctomycetota bacterium]
MNRRSFLIACSLLLVPTALFAKDKKEKPPVFVVVQRGEEEFEAVDVKKLKERKKEIAKEYKEAVKEWDKAKKAARKAKEKFEDPKPKAPVFKVVAKGLKGEDAAKAKIEQILEAIRKAKEKKQQKKDKK